MDSISITIPMQHDALIHAASMLQNIAADLNRDVLVNPDADNDGSGDNDGDTPPPKKDNVTPITSRSTPATNPHKTTPPPPANETTTPPEGVELDKEGLPWDGRIHGAKKAKTAKGMWKKIKNLEKNKPGELARVEAELKAAMAASPDAPITSTTPPPPENTATTPPPPKTETPAPPETVTMYLVDGKEFTYDQLLAATWSDAAIAALETVEKAVDSPDPAATTATAITFPEFMAKYTPAIAAGTITQEMVTAALNKQGLESIPLLASRPDLLPAVHAELFPQ